MKFKAARKIADAVFEPDEAGGVRERYGEIDAAALPPIEPRVDP